MRILVGQHELKIDEETINEKEINITKCEFIFDEAITDDFVKDVYFTLNGETYQIADIQNNECDIPSEVLDKHGMVEVGVVAYLLEDDEYVKRYNPTPTYFPSEKGSLKDKYENAEKITPTDKEQIEQLLNDGLQDIADAVESASHLDIDVSKENKTTTVTITKQDETTKSAEINDGVSLQYNWVSTNLGIKREDESNYEYVNLKGDKGEPGQIEFTIVNELPETGTEGIIYLVPVEDPEQENKYNEYIYVDDEWELLGEIGVDIDLSNYYTKQEVNNLIPTALSELTDDTTHRLVTDTEKTTWNNKLDQSDLVNYVTKTDYATSSTGGVVKIPSMTASGLLVENGSLYVYPASESQISAKSNNRNPITSSNLNYAIEKGLGNNSLTWTNTEKTNARNTIGAISSDEVDGKISEEDKKVEYYKKYSNTLEDITTTDTTINEVIDECPMDIELKASEIEQETTTGKNLLKLNQSTSQSRDGVTFTINSDGSVLINGTASADTYCNIYSSSTASILTDTNKTYTFSKGTTNTNVGIWFFEYVSGDWSPITYTTNNTAAYTPSGNQTGQMYRVLVKSGGQFNNVLVYPMIVEGTTVGDYEKYTGGKAAPNPDYPQEVHTITGNNEVKIVNKNLLKNTATTKTVAGITFTKNEDGSLTLNGTSTGFGQMTLYSSASECLFSENTAYTFYSGQSSKNLFVYAYEYYNNTWNQKLDTAKIGAYTPTGQALGQRFDLAFSSGISFSNETIYPMIVKGSYTLETVGDYVPHKEQTYPITLGNLEYCKIGDYEADFVQGNGTQLFDKSTITTGKYIDGSGNLIDDNSNFAGDYIQIDNTKSYYINADSQSAKRIAYYDSTKTFISRELISTYGGSITIPNNAKFVRLSCYNVDLESLMFNEGTTALPYSPYGKGKWYLKKNIGKIVLDGTNNAVSYLRLGNAINTGYKLINDIVAPSSNDDLINVESSHFVAKSINYLINNVSIGIGVRTDKILFLSFGDDSNYTTTEQINSWLSNNNVEVYYPLATPTYTLLNDTLQEQLNNIEYALSYSQTNIIQTNSDLSFIVNSTLKKELPTKISAFENDSHYIKNTDVATGRYDAGKAGIVGIGAGNGIGISSGNLYIDKATSQQITAETSNYAPIVASNYRSAVNRVLKTQTGYDQEKTQVLKNINGTLTWVDE